VTTDLSSEFIKLGVRHPRKTETNKLKDFVDAPVDHKSLACCWMSRYCAAACCWMSWYCAAAFFWQVLKLCTDLDRTLFYILIRKTYTKFVLNNKMLALGVCHPQPRSAAASRFAGTRSRSAQEWRNCTLTVHEQRNCPLVFIAR